jgi:plastocyanin
MKTKLLAGLSSLLVFGGPCDLSAATNTVLIGNYFFNPTNLTIAVGDTIRWTNTASLTTHDTRSTNVAFAWSSPTLAAGSGTYTLTFSNAGTYPYFCNQHVFANLPQNRHPEQTGTVSVVAINLAPTISLTNPVNNVRFRAPTNLLLQATASDDGSVTNVQFFSGANLLGSDTAAPYSFDFNNAPGGNYAFTARAQDNTGLAATSTVINVFLLTNALLTAPERLPNDTVRFTVQGISGQTYAAESSSNLAAWSAFATNVAPANSFNITDITAPSVLQRFYRTRQD